MNRYTPKEYMQICIANHYGNERDKLQFEDRIAWVNQEENNLEQLEDQADDYFQYCAAVEAYRKAQRGEKIGYLTGLDCCASGIQLLSVLTGCSTGAKNTGLIGDTREDVYATSTEVMNDLLGSNMKHKKDVVKPALMTLYYDSEKEPKDAFGENTPELASFYQTAEIVAPGAYRALGLIRSLQDPEALSYHWDYPDGFKVNYKVKEKLDSTIEIDTLTPHKKFKYRCTHNIALDKIRFLPAGVAHGCDGYIVRELTARCDYDDNLLEAVEYELIQRLKEDIEVSPLSYIYIEKMYRKHNCISLEGINFVTPWSVKQMSSKYCKALLSLVRETRKKPSFKVITIFDEFKALPNYMNEVRQTYIDIVAEIAESNILQANLTDIYNSNVEVIKLDPDLPQLIRQGNYGLS